MRKYLGFILLAISFIIATPTITHADTFSLAYENEDSDYIAYIIDEAELLSHSEQEELLEDMEDITEYGNAVFLSIEYNPQNDVEEFAEDFYYEMFQEDNGVLFLIDMDTRSICVHAQGSLQRIITSGYANSICDNVYNYASDEDYYACASEAFDQIYTLLEGGRIAQPMKYISNAFLAVILALLINYFLVMMLSRSRKATTSQLISGIYSNVEIKNARANFVNQTKVYSPQSSGSSGKGGGGGRSGGSSGSHKF